MNPGTGRFLKALSVGLIMLALTACASNAQQDTPDQADNREQASQRMADQLRALQEESQVPEPAQPGVPAELDDLLLDRELPSRDSTRFDVSATDVPLDQFLEDLSEVAGTNILLDGGVSGQVTLRLRDVTANDVMTALQDQKGIAFERTNYGFRVSGDQLQTEMFRVNYLDIQRTGQSSTGVAGGQIGGGDSQASQINTQNTTDFWGTLENTLSLMMESGGDRQLVVNPQTGLIIVKASPRELRSIGEFLTEAELALQQQVIIEARIIEVNLSDTFQSGIDWSILGRDGDLKIGAGVDGSQPSGGELDGMFNLSLASSTIRETDSVIRAGNGQVVVIGGLLQNELTSLRSGIPGSGDGFFRRLFGQERTTSERTELIILLRPIIADADSFNEDIDNTATRLLEP